MTWMQRYDRQWRAELAMAAAVTERGDRERLLAILRSTGAQSANYRLDDLCAVYCRGPLGGADIDRIIGRDEQYITVRVRMYGAGYLAPEAWLHSWTRRRVHRKGEWVVRSYAEWLDENVTCILRKGTTEVRTWHGEWTRIAEEADYLAIATAAAIEAHAA